ncbi:MAG: hypothetical protein ACHQUC_09925 [Chlamydiales bacterium]
MDGNGQKWTDGHKLTPQCPFSVHPSTNLVCVPFDVQEEFSPTHCPHLNHLIEKGETAFKKHVDLFENYVGKLLIQ